MTLRQRESELDRLRVERAGDGYRVLLHARGIVRAGHGGTAADRMPTLLALFTLTDPRLAAIEADVSDGELSGPGIVSFCSPSPEAVLVPDPGFMQTRGYARFRALTFDAGDVWSQRSDIIRWRGSTTGSGGDIANEPMDPATLIPRVAMCLKLRGVPGVDAKIAAVAQADDPDTARRRLARAGILGERIEPIAWLGSRYAIDIDGNSNAWSNLFTRLLLGNCVIKVASPAGYRQWYYDRLEPYRHYVPVRADMSDLIERIAWCRANPDACIEIARAGRSLALSLKVEGETRAAVARLNALVPS